VRTNLCAEVAGHAAKVQGEMLFIDPNGSKPRLEVNSVLGGDMEVRVSLADDGRIDELESLNDWLKGEPQLAGRIRVSRAAPAQGELGSLSDALVVAVGSGGTLSVLAASLHAWLSRPRRSDVRIRVQGSDGRVAEIAADRVDPQQAETLLRQVLEFGSASE
jgi:hypothetical protein